MPGGMSGEEVINTIAEMKKSGQLPSDKVPKFVLCSGDEIDNYLQMGFQYFLPKPIVRDNLKELCLLEDCKLNTNSNEENGQF